MLYVLYISESVYTSLTPSTNPTLLKSVSKSPNHRRQEEEEEHDTSPERWKYLAVNAPVTDLTQTTKVIVKLIT